MLAESSEEPGHDLYLQYQVGNEFFASAIRDVFLILNSFGIIQVPNSPEYMPGAISHGGMILPVVNMRLKLNMLPLQQQCDDYTILVMNLKDRHHFDEFLHVGLMVDKVTALHRVYQKIIDPPVQNLFPSYPNFIQGMLHIKDLDLMIPDTSNLFKREELAGMMEACSKL